MFHILEELCPSKQPVVCNLVLLMLIYCIYYTASISHNITCLLCLLLHCQKQAQANVCLTMGMVKEALDQLRGAVMIVYPMGLPPHDPIKMEFEHREDLSGTQVKD